MALAAPWSPVALAALWNPVALAAPRTPVALAAPQTPVALAAPWSPVALAAPWSTEDFFAFEWFVLVDTYANCASTNPVIDSSAPSVSLRPTRLLSSPRSSLTSSSSATKYRLLLGA